MKKAVYIVAFGIPTALAVGMWVHILHELYVNCVDASRYDASLTDWLTMGFVFAVFITTMVIVVCGFVSAGLDCWHRDKEEK